MTVCAFFNVFFLANSHAAQPLLAAMQDGKLRREKLELFFSKRIAVNPPAAASKARLDEHYRRILAQYNEGFEPHGRVIASLLEPHGCRVASMSTEDLYGLLRDVL